MPCCVYANKTGVTERTVVDNEIRKLVTDLRNATGRHWEIERTSYPKKVKLGWLRSGIKHIDTYSVYLYLGGEWQLINFPPSEAGGYSLNLEADYRTLMTMLHWYMEGIEERPRRFCFFTGTGGLATDRSSAIDIANRKNLLALIKDKQRREDPCLCNVDKISEYDLKIEPGDVSLVCGWSNTHIVSLGGITIGFTDGPL